MKLYHSSTISVERPDTVHSREFLDFGKGFYLTSIYNQAIRYAQRYLNRNKDAWINTYDFTFVLSEWEGTTI